MVKIRKLNCGIRVAMEEIPYVQSAAIGILTRTGSVNEIKKIEGISHLIEHMMFKGTEKRSAKQIAEDVDKIGGQMNAFTGKEATCYYIKTLAANVDRALEILLDMFLNSTFDKKELSKEKKVICEEMKMIEDSPEDMVHDMICEQIFKGLPLGRSIIGTPTSLRGISRDTIFDYIKKQYTLDSIVIAISGRFDEEHICEVLEGRLSSLEKTKPCAEAGELPYKPSYRVKVKDIEQAHICLGTRGLALEDDRYYALALLSNIFGGSMSSRLFQNIREEKGLAYSVYSMYSSFSDAGYFNIYAGTSHETIGEAIDGIKEELKALEEKGVSAEELATAKEQLKSSYIFGQENVAGRMFQIGKNAVLLNKVYTPEEVLSGIDAVTLSDIQDMAQNLCDVRNYCGAAVTNKKINLKSMIWK